MREQLSPQDNLWLEILLTSKTFKNITDTQAKEQLVQGGFPQQIINNFLILRK
jgi:hypothetical protein